MWFVILWLTLGILTITHRLISRHWITGQAAFTGAWFASLTPLWFLPQVWQIFSGYAVLIIILSHGSFFCGSSIIKINSLKSFSSRRKTFHLNNNSFKIFLYAFWICFSLGLAGNILTAIRIETFIHLKEHSLALLRHYLFEQIVPLLFYERILSIFSYPAALFGAICFLFSSGKSKLILYILLSIVIILLNSINRGGRGALIIGGLMIAWSIIIGRGINLKDKNLRDNIALFGIVFVMLWYFIFIFKTRLFTFGDQEGICGIGELAFWYLCGPIPAFNEWVIFHEELPIINFDISKYSIIREFLNLLGFQIERTIDRDVVLNPYPLNVFTHLSEYLLYFGIIGTPILCFFWGLTCGIIENKSYSINRIAIRATLYSYLTFSFYGDIGSLAVGWWLAFFILATVFPLLENFIFSKKTAIPLRSGAF